MKSSPRSPRGGADDTSTHARTLEQLARRLTKLTKMLHRIKTILFEVLHAVGDKIVLYSLLLWTNVVVNSIIITITFLIV